MKYLPANFLPGKQVSRIGLGIPRFGSKVSQELAFAMLDIFLANGGTLIDTARNYYEWLPDSHGKSEACLGAWMQSRRSREKICLCTKGGVHNEGQKWQIDLSAIALRKDLSASLEALQTESIDIYLLHRDEPERPVEEIVDTMQEIAEIGKVGHIGVANWQLDRIKEANAYAAMHGLRRFDVVQTWWSLAEYTDAFWNDPHTTHMTDDMYEYLMANNIMAMAYSSQCKGFFQKAVRQGYNNIDDFLRKRIVTERNLLKLGYIVRLCEEQSVSPTAIVNGYITCNRLSGVALVSCSTVQQLQEVLANVDNTLPQSVIDGLDRL